MEQNNQNRVDEYLRKWQVPLFERLFFPGNVRDERLNFLESAQRRFKGNLSLPEQRTMALVNEEANQINRRAQSPFFRRIIDPRDRLIASVGEFIQARRGRDGHSSAVAEALRESHMYWKHLPVISPVMWSIAKKGLPDHLNSDALADLYANQPAFVAKYTVPIGEDTLKYDLKFEKSARSGQYYASEAEVTLKRPVTIESRAIAGVNLPELEDRIARLDPRKDYFNKDVALSLSPQKNAALLDQFGAIIKDLTQIRDSGDPDGRRVFDQLTYKFMAGTPNEKHFPGIPLMRDLYEVKARVNVDSIDTSRLTPEHMYNMLEGRSVHGAGKPGHSQWYAIKDFNQPTLDGFLEIRPVMPHSMVNIDAAIIKAGISDLRDPDGKQNARRMIENGGLLIGTLMDNGLMVDRMLAFDPTRNAFRIDVAESRKRGLIVGHDEQAQQTIAAFKEALDNTQSKQAIETVGPSRTDPVQENNLGTGAGQANVPSVGGTTPAPGETLGNPSGTSAPDQPQKVDIGSLTPGGPKLDENQQRLWNMLRDFDKQGEWKLEPPKKPGMKR